MGLLRHTRTGRSMALLADTTVGRAQGADLVVDDGRASRTHATLRWEDGSWWIRDRRSTNGTWLSGERLPSEHWQQLESGAVVRFGSRAEEWVLVDAGTPRRSQSSEARYSVYISYSRDSGLGVAVELANRLEERGARTFFDCEYVIPGESTREMVEGSVRVANVAVALVPPHWTEVSDKWLSAEWAAIREEAWSRTDFRVVPVLLRGAQVPACWNEWPAEILPESASEELWHRLLDAILNRRRLPLLTSDLGEPSDDSRDRTALLEQLAKDLGEQR